MKLVAWAMPAAFLAAAVPAGNLAQAAGSVTYQQSVQCAALDTVIAGVLKSGNPPSEQDKQKGEEFSEMARRWLHLATTLNPKGDDATFADYGSAVNALANKLTATRTVDEVNALLLPSLARCHELDAAISD